MDAHVEECGGEVGVGEAGFGKLDGGEGDSTGLHEVHGERIRGHKFGRGGAGFNGVAARIFEG